MQIIYEQHPVSAERKSFLRQKGYKIVDAAFAPEDYESPEPVNQAKGGKPAQGKKALQEELKLRGIEFDGRGGIADLQALIDADDLAKLKAALTEKGVEFTAENTAEELSKLLEEAK